MNRVRSIGLTGGIGSGKSTVGHMLVRLGAHLVDTDAIARQLTAPGGLALPALQQAFGPDILDADGAMDRARMREKVFHDPAALHTLEGILHPLIGQEAARQALQAAPDQVVVFDVPLLVESGRRWRDIVDKVLVVDASPQTQVQRVVSRSGWTPEAVQAVIARQATREQRRVVADHVVDNDQVSLAELDHHVQTVWRLWTQS